MSFPRSRTQPTSQTVIAGQTATFIAAASGTPTPTVQWQLSTNGGKTFTNMADGTSTTLTLTGTTVTQNGYQYRAVFTNNAGSATTKAATLTVKPLVAPKITTQPTSQTVIAGQTATFIAAASGTPTPTVQWQLSTNGGKTFTNMAGGTSTTLTLTGTTTTQSGTQYRAVFTNSRRLGTSNAATLTVKPLVAPKITTQPTSQTVIAGQTATFTAGASGTPTTVQWQLSTNAGKTFSNIAGATATTLKLTGTTTTQSGTQYRAVFTNGVGSATTRAADPGRFARPTSRRRSERPQHPCRYGLLVACAGSTQGQQTPRHSAALRRGRTSAEHPVLEGVLDRDVLSGTRRGDFLNLVSQVRILPGAWKTTPQQTRFAIGAESTGRDSQRS